MTKSLTTLVAAALSALLVATALFAAEPTTPRFDILGVSGETRVGPAASAGVPLAAGDAPSPTRAPTRLAGGFIQPWASDRGKTVADWAKELEAMKAIRMSLVIIQYDRKDGVVFSGITERILAAADALKMKVFVGTDLNEDGWYTKKRDPGFLAKEASGVALYTRALVRKFAHHASFKGVYIPYEDNGMFPDAAEAMGAFYCQIALAARQEKRGLKVMISPFTAWHPSLGLRRSTAHVATYFTKMLSNASVDICAWQDGVGCAPGRVSFAHQELAAMVKACRATGTTCWANLESFQQTSLPGAAFAAQPAPIERFMEQLDREGALVQTAICFDFNHYMSPRNGNAKAAQLYAGYRSQVLGLP